MDKGSRRIKSYVLTLLMLSVFLLKPSYNLMAANRKLVTHKEINPEILFKEEGEETYKPLTKQSVLSGKVDFIVRLPNGHKGYEYIDYKINGFYHAPAKGPEYKTTIDTTKLPNSWNQLVAIGYNLQLEGAKQVLFKVNNEKEKVIRPKRVEGYPIWKKPIYKRNYIPVLMYHDFQENITKEQESAVVHPKLFEEQIKTLLKNGYIPVDFYDLLLYKQGKGGLPNKPFIITADDGYLSNYTTAYPILKKYNVPATFFVSTRYVGVNLYSPHFTWEQAKEMEESGLIDIQSHSHSHIPLNYLPDEEVRYEASTSFGIIEQNLGKRDVRVLAYPEFRHSNKTKEIVKEEGAQLQVTKLARPIEARTEYMNIQRIHVANFTSPQKLLKEIEKLTR